MFGIDLDRIGLCCRRSTLRRTLELDLRLHFPEEISILVLCLVLENLAAVNCPSKVASFRTR